MRRGFYWAGVEYSQKFQERLKSVIRSVFNGELARDEMAAALKKAFEGEIKHGVSYFAGLGDHIISQAQNVSTITQAQKYGVKFYKVVARMDSRTSEICRCMHGRIIPASHLENQANKIINAKNMSEKKAAAMWMSGGFNAKTSDLPHNFGLPPYHFRCRSEVVPVWIDEYKVDGVKMRATKAPKNDEILRHIDKMGVERVVDKYNYIKGKHTTPLYKKAKKEDIIKALNSINEIAPNKKNKNRLNSFSDNGFFIVFNGDRIVTFIPPKNGNKKAIYNYFKQNSIKDKREVIKWNLENLKSHFMG
ncbi:hypothetical protein F1B92_06300 [Campylobacter sp. FMV-PI01]|uniref:Phage head morphogenesis domain-containing protein n=2 Tax=Campylobacter portucalensis TaxID=2608384 RepID=A0A6L5WI97_9BACT|nr:hypothetical protein [Campylobacter portucalensis]